MRILGVVSSSSREVPNAPTIGTATDVGTGRAYNNGAATVTFTAPTWTGGLPITGYTVTSSPGGYTGTGSSSPITVTGLQSSTAYTFTVTATNSRGTSAASAASNSITATTVPQAPTIGTATAGNASATVTYTANATGGKAVSTYTATSSPGSLTGTGSSPITVSGLTNGTAYTFTVTATNANGTSTASAASNSVTPASSYWIEYTNAGAGGNNISHNVIYTGTNYAAGFVPNSTSAGYMLMDSTGAITSQNQMTFSGTTPTFSVNGFTYDFTGSPQTFYLVGGAKTGSSGTRNAYAIYQSGSWTNVQWLNDTNSFGATMYAIAKQRGGTTCYAGGMYRNGSAQTFFAQNRFSLGSPNSLYSYGGDGGFANKVAVDTSGQGWLGGGANNNVSTVALFSNDTAIFYGSFSALYNPAAVACYSTAYNYVFSARNASLTGTEVYFVGIAAAGAGTISWQRRFTGLASVNDMGGGVMDSSGNSYFAWQMNSTSWDFVIVKYNNSGVLQWQRRFVLSGQTGTSLFNIDTDGTNLFVGFTRTNPDIMRYPCDGSVTGSYSYRGGTLTISASSFSESASSVTMTTPSFTRTTRASYTPTSGSTSQSTPTFSVTQKVSI
jgi:hypothetical protein